MALLSGGFSGLVFSSAEDLFPCFSGVEILSTMI